MNDILNDIEFLKSIKKQIEDQQSTDLIVGKINEVIDSKEKEVEAYEKTVDFFFKDTPFK